MKRNWGCLWLFAFPLLVTAGCAEGGVDPVVPGGPIVFRVGFAGDGGATRVATGADFESVLEDGDAIGVFVVKNGAAIGEDDVYTNVELSYSADSGEWTPPGAEELVWPEEGGKFDFYAYYPYDPEFDPAADPTFDPAAAKFTVGTDQNGAGFSAGDLMTAADDGGGGGLESGSTVTLAFGHAFAMMQLTLDASMVPHDPAAPPVVTLRGVECSAMVDLVTGEATAADSVGNITMQRTWPDTLFDYRALVPAGQTLGAGAQLFQIDFADRVFRSEPLATPLTLVGGQAETFALAPRLDDYAEVIADQNLKNACVAWVERNYGNGDGVLSYEEIMAVDRMEIGLTSTFSSLEGIGIFKNLVELDCCGSGLTKMDVSSLTKLEWLACDDNDLTELNVSGLTSLTFLACNYNQLTLIDVSTNSSLKRLFCGNVGSPELTVEVDPLRTLGSADGELDIQVCNPLGLWENEMVAITEKGVAVHGVTVVDKQ